MRYPFRSGGNGIKRKLDDAPCLLPEVEPTLMDRLMEAIPVMHSRTEYEQYLQNGSNIAELVIMSYEDFAEIAEIRRQRLVDNKVQYCVAWAPHPIKQKDVDTINNSNMNYRCRCEPLDDTNPTGLMALT